MSRFRVLIYAVFSFIILIISLLVCLKIDEYYLYAKAFVNEPLIVFQEPIAVSPLVNTNIDFHTELENEYYLELDFYAPNFTEEQIDRIVGNSSKKNGVILHEGIPLPVKVKIYSLDNAELVLQKEVETKNGSGVFKERRRGVTSVYLKPGKYRLVLQTIKDVPEFSGIQVEV